MISQFKDYNSMSTAISKIEKMHIMIDNLPQLSNLSSKSASTILAAQELSNFQNALPSAAEINKMLSSADEYLEIQNALPDFNTIQSFLASEPQINELIKLQSQMPSLSEFKKLQSALPSTMELNQYFAEIKTLSSSSLNYIHNLKLEFGSYFSYEDLYENAYGTQYSKIDFEKNDLVCKDDNPFELNVRDNKTFKEYPLLNQKDVNGLTALFDTISKKDAIDFINFLSKYPYLGLSHEIGRLILDELRKKSDHFVHCITQTSLYRARIWEEDQDFHYTIPQLWQAPYGIPQMGRFNPIGINYLYMADSLQTASTELKQEKGFTVMETSIKNNISILDLSDDAGIIFELCNKRKASSSSNPQEYLLPNFIAQCCTYLADFEDKKIEGFRYKSTLSEKGYSYVFFNKYPDSFTQENIVNL
jgi:hypothetical protein